MSDPESEEQESDEEQEDFQQRTAMEWSPVELASWLNTQHPDLKDEGRLLQENEIPGKTLALVEFRQCLKDIGIGSIGKQLAVLACIRELLSRVEIQSSPKSAQSPSKLMKAKITKKIKMK